MNWFMISVGNQLDSSDFPRPWPQGSLSGLAITWNTGGVTNLTKRRSGIYFELLLMSLDLRTSPICPGSRSISLRISGVLSTRSCPSFIEMNKPEVIRLSKCARLHELIASPQLDFLLEAHNGISVRIVEEAGFRGIWASGLALSAQYGVRDNNEASWTQVVEMLEFMSDITQIPILLDGNTGYGNFNNLRRLVKKLEQRGIAGVCIEDKRFPKTNSFIAS